MEPNKPTKHQLQLVSPSISCSIVVFSSLARHRHLPFFSLFLQFYSVANQNSKVHYLAGSHIFLLIITWSDRLAEIKWFVCISKPKRTLYLSFSRTDSGLYIYDLCVYSNFNFLRNSRWIIFTIQSYLVLYSFFANLLHSFISWVLRSG